MSSIGRNIINPSREFHGNHCKQLSNWEYFIFLVRHIRFYTNAITWTNQIDLFNLQADFSRTLQEKILLAVCKKEWWGVQYLKELLTSYIWYFQSCMFLIRLLLFFILLYSLIYFVIEILVATILSFSTTFSP